MNDRFHNIAWPAVIVLLLLTSVGMMTAVLVAARSDGGAQVVDNYYNRAVAWDSLAAVAATSAERGWNIDVDLDSDGGAVLVVVDSMGVSVPSLVGEVRVRRPHLARPVGEYELRPDPEHPGRYDFAIEATGRGIWIFDVQLTRGDLVHVDELRVRVDIE